MKSAEQFYLDAVEYLASEMPPRVVTPLSVSEQKIVKAHCANRDRVVVACEAVIAHRQAVGS